MTKLEDITKAVEELSPEELAKFRTWFEDLQARHWDEQIKRDIQAGKLDKLAERWRADHRDGKSTDLVPPSRSHRGSAVGE